MSVTIGVPTPPHEPDRVPLSPVVTSAVWLAIVIVATHVVVWTSLPLSHSPAAGTGPIPTTTASQDWGVAGKEELRALRAREQANLSSYQWLDERRTAARIPIDRAMEAMASRPQGAQR